MGLEVMLGIWAVQLGQLPCKLAGLKRKSNIALEFRAAPRISPSLEGGAKRDSIVNPLVSSAHNSQGSTFLNLLYLSPCVLGTGCSRRVVGSQAVPPLFLLPV